jgi:hypothetical protein
MPPALKKEYFLFLYVLLRGNMVIQKDVDCIIGDGLNIVHYLKGQMRN